MPQTWCKCHGCLASGPGGRSFSRAEYKIHQLRLQREEQQDRPLASQSAVENELFARSVADNNSVPFDAPSAMWNSREHIQARAFDISPSPDSANTTTTTSFVADSIRRLTSHNQPSSTRDTDDLAETFDRLNIGATHIISATPAETPLIHDANNLADEFDQLNVTGSHPSPITSSHANTSYLPNIMDPSPSSVDSPASNRHLHASRDKRETNVHTTRALKVLHDVDRLMQENAGKLVGSPTKSVRDGVANTISQSRQKVEKVTRSTPQINASKENVARHILHVENRLIELDTLFPSTHGDRTVPVEHSNGE
jgi:hypothetical protein